MKTYHGERTKNGCVVTVDGKPLRMRSDLSGNATTAFDWGYIGSGQLSLALLSDYFGSDVKARAMSDVFDQEILARLPEGSWTMTDYALTAALASLVSLDGTRADDIEDNGSSSAAFGDMPATGTDLA